MFGGSRSIKLVSIAGIRIGVDLTWFAMLFLLIFLLSGSFRTALGSSTTVAYVTTVATVLLFFASLIVHELGHAVAARRHGIEVNRIELFLFGGTTYMSRDSLTPGEEFKIAAAGPLGTLLVLVVCVIVDMAVVGPHRLLHAIELDNTVTITPVLLSLSWLLPMNLLILAFNLVPAYPLDGGRIARAAVWRMTGDKLRGTRVAAWLGQGFAVLLGAFGLFLAAEGYNLTGIWLAVLAFMIWQSARGALKGAAVTARVQGVLVGDIMDPEPVFVSASTPAAQALDESFLRYHAPWLPVVDEIGRFVGISRRYRVEEAARTGVERTTIDSVLETEEMSRLRVDQALPLTDVLSLEALGRMGAVIVVDGDGVLRGVVTLEQVRRAMQAVFSSPVRS